MNGLILDAGAFIALDRDDRRAWAFLNHALHTGRRLLTHAGIIGQVWRNPSRQARLARALKVVAVAPLNAELAKATGLLLAATGRHDVHDAALALLCTHGDIILTSDTDDMGALLAERQMESVSLIRV